MTVNHGSMLDEKTMCIPFGAMMGPPRNPKPPPLSDVEREEIRQHWFTTYEHRTSYAYSKLFWFVLGALAYCGWMLK